MNPRRALGIVLPLLSLLLLAPRAVESHPIAPVLVLATSVAQGDPAPSPPPATVQQKTTTTEEKKVEVQSQPAQAPASTTTTTREVWYVSPMWLAIGGLAVVVAILLIAVAVRGGGPSSTVVRQ